MIAHFIKRDFATYKFFWVIFVLISLGGIPLLLATRTVEAVVALGYAYFFFAMLPAQNLTGVNWRSQHIMSRNYMLALPIRRKTVFNITQLRALVFWLPLLVLMAAAPLIVERFGDKLAFSQYSYLAYLISILAAAVWFINQQLEIQIDWERITSYLTLQRRTLAWIRSIGGMLVQAWIGIGLLIAIPRITAWWFVAFAVALSGLSFRRTRRKWLGTA